MADEQQLRERVITALAGPGTRLREDQTRAIDALMEPGARVLVVQATGWGKSAVYWVATALWRARGAGPTLVVSPLLSLMRDQIAAAERAGLVAASVNSGNIEQWSQIESQVRAGEVDVLLVSPERLANPGFGRRVLDALDGRLGLLVIDEAHAVSDWGHDFRPDYRRLTTMLQTMSPQTPVLATTATANARVTDDVAATLGEATLVLRGPLARPSLHLSVVPRLTPLQRMAWVADALPSLPGSGIVYALTVADTERITAAIKAVHGDEFPVAAYTGQLDIDTRHRLEDALRRNELKALVATSALGMGYDKPDLGFVVHVGAPPSPVSYYQQVGRAGRAIDRAVVALLPSDSDAGVWDYFATATIPDPDQMNRLLAALPVGESPVPALEAETGLRRTRVELMLKQLAVDGAVCRVDDGWQATGAAWHYDAEHYAGIVATRQREADIMRAYTRGEQCLMQLLQDSLNDPTAAPCGRCSVCLGQLPEGLPASADPQTVRTVTTQLRASSHLLEPRKMWPGGAFGRRGRIGADERAEPGRVLVHADAPEWAETLHAARTGDPAAIAELSAAAVRTLSAWRADWVARPQVVVGVGVGEVPAVAAGVAEAIGAAGRLPVSTMTVAEGPSPSRELAGPEEAAVWAQRLTPAGVDGAAVAGKVVLLVVDSSSTGWSVTVASAALRAAGAAAVLPLLLHRTV